MRRFQDISSIRQVLGAVGILLFTSCGENSYIEVIDPGVVGDVSAELSESIEIDFISEIEQDFECDPVVRRPNREIEYSEREITIAEHFSFSPKSSTPGSDWCLNSEFESTESEV